MTLSLTYFCWLKKRCSKIENQNVFYSLSAHVIKWIKAKWNEWNCISLFNIYCYYYLNISEISEGQIWRSCSSVVLTELAKKVIATNGVIFFARISAKPLWQPLLSTNSTKSRVCSGENNESCIKAAKHSCNGLLLLILFAKWVRDEFWIFRSHDARRSTRVLLIKSLDARKALKSIVIDSLERSNNVFTSDHVFTTCTTSLSATECVDESLTAVCCCAGCTVGGALIMRTNEIIVR